MGVAADDSIYTGQAVGEWINGLVAGSVRSLSPVCAHVPNGDDRVDLALRFQLGYLSVDCRRRIGDDERIEVAGEDQAG